MNRDTNYAIVISVSLVGFGKTLIILSGRQDSNLRPLAPKASALAGLRHAPIYQDFAIFRAKQELDVIKPAEYNAKDETPSSD